VQALLAGLLQHEQQGLGTSLEEDEQLLEGFKRLPTAQQQLQQLAEQYDAMQRDLEAISQQLAAHAAAEATAVPADSEASAGTSQQQGGTAVAVAATAAAGALPPEAVYAMTAEERRLQQRAREALQQQGQLEEEVAALTRRVTGVRRVAVEYRVQKKRLLAAVRQKLA
jgi:chaperonin cofactor prefoldin